MSSKNLTSRQKQAIEAKQRIYSASLELIHEVGVEHFTINDICHKLDISVGAFYHYFKSKEELLNTIYYSADNSFSIEIDQTQGEDHIFENIVNYYKWYAKYNESLGIDFCKQFYHGKNTSINSYLRKNIDYILGQCGLFVLKYNPSSPYRSKDSLYAALSAIGRGVVFDWCIQEGCYNMEEHMGSIISTFLRGLAPESIN